MSKERQRVRKLDYHRNGIGGLGFWVGIVTETEGRTKREMLVVRFPKETDKETGSVVCAAFDLALLDKRIIGFGENSWRGDHYDEAMDAAIKVEEARPFKERMVAANHGEVN